MPKSFASVLYEGFENNAALRLPADHLLTILRRAGATISAHEGAKIIRYLGVDSNGYVDAGKFCAWFEGIEQEPRFANLVPIALTSSESVEAALRPESGSSGSNDASDAQRGQVEQGVGAAHGTANLDDDGADHLGGEGRDGEDGGQGQRRIARFDQQVTSDDGAAWLLASEDRCTLPERRRLTEHEKLKASLVFSMNKVAAHLEASPVKFQPE
eukprot:TRINITY_DN12479_c0_g1_i1.p1 TRINITY_DN12479_c0_g1~~TRINITY_DN12479_c0_g1_i1.p1  ORF type:complete len:230 (+),score=40.25 TRINITY_DN12479_c0_g1_i1:49-690(+)